MGGVGTQPPAGRPKIPDPPPPPRHSPRVSTARTGLRAAWGGARRKTVNPLRTSRPPVYAATMRKTLAALVALAVAGCTPTPAAPATSSSSPSPSPTPTPTSTPTRDLSNLARREKITLRDEAGDIGTLAYIQGKAAKSPYRDGPLYTAKVKACATERKMTVASFGWLVETADGEQYEAASDQGDGDPKPMYPLFDRSLPKGKCLQGWIVFEISKGAKISHVGYQVSDEQTVFWKV